MQIGRAFRNREDVDAGIVKKPLEPVAEVVIQDDGSQKTVITPVVEIAPHRRHRRKSFGSIRH